MGMTPADMPELAGLITDGLRTDPTGVTSRTSAMRRRFPNVHFVRN